MSDERRHIVVIGGLNRMKRALEATVIRSPEQDHRFTALNYLHLTEDVLLSAARDADWLDKTSDQIPEFDKIITDIESAANEQVWVRVLRASYQAFRSLPGDPAWRPKDPIPPP